MNDFAKRSADRIRETERQQAEHHDLVAANNRAFAERESLKRKLGPALWHKFRGLVIAKTQEVNKELGKEYYREHDELPNKLHVIRINPVANLRLEFFEDGSRIHYDCGSCVGDYLVAIDESTGQAVMRNVYQQTMDMEATAEFLLEDCLAKAQF